MSGETPGQVACETWQTRRIGVDRTGTWAVLSLEQREHWEAAVQAAIDVFLAGDSVSAGSIREAIAAAEREPQPAPELAAAMAETRELRSDLRTLADLWDASSDRDEASATRPNRARLVLEERATTRRQCAADIRKLAGLPK